jgi:hypothetical protein
MFLLATPGIVILLFYVCLKIISHVPLSRRKKILSEMSRYLFMVLNMKYANCQHVISILHVALKCVINVNVLIYV